MGDEGKNLIQDPKSLHEVALLIADLKKSFIDQNAAREKQLNRIETTLTTDMNKVKQRLDQIEKPPFDPERTLVFTGVKPSEETADHVKIQNLIEATGVQCTIRNVKRLVPNHENTVGIIKCELDSLDEKIQVLRNKRHIITTSQGVWVRSSKTHTDRVMSSNFQTILSLIPGGDGFKMAGNGIIIPKPEREEETEDYNQTAENDNQNETHAGNRPRGAPWGSQLRGGYRGRGGPYRGRGRGGQSGYTRGPRGTPRGGRGRHTGSYRNQASYAAATQGSAPGPSVKLDNKFATLQNIPESDPTPAEAYHKTPPPSSARTHKNDRTSVSSDSSVESHRPAKKKPRHGHEPGNASVGTQDTAGARRDNNQVPPEEDEA